MVEFCRATFHDTTEYLGQTIAMNDTPEVPRMADVADLPMVEEVIRCAYTKYTSRMDILPAPMLRDFAELIADRRIWTVGDPVQGVIGLSPEGNALLVDNVAVHPSAQGTGLGRRLMEFAEREAVRRGLERLKLYTHKVMVENVDFYIHLGYVVVDRRTDDGRPRVFMEKLLADIQ
jgi:GNAT superfamily N-acetyltransferase